LDRVYRTLDIPFLRKGRGKGHGQVEEVVKSQRRQQLDLDHKATRDINEINIPPSRIRNPVIVITSLFGLPLEDSCLISPTISPPYLYPLEGRSEGKERGKRL